MGVYDAPQWLLSGWTRTCEGAGATAPPERDPRRRLTAHRPLVRAGPPLPQPQAPRARAVAGRRAGRGDPRARPRPARRLVPRRDLRRRREGRLRQPRRRGRGRQRRARPRPSCAASASRRGRAERVHDLVVAARPARRRTRATSTARCCATPTSRCSPPSRSATRRTSRRSAPSTRTCRSRTTCGPAARILTKLVNRSDAVRQPARRGVGGAGAAERRRPSCTGIQKELAALDAAHAEPRTGADLAAADGSGSSTAPSGTDAGTSSAVDTSAASASGTRAPTADGRTGGARDGGRPRPARRRRPCRTATPGACRPSAAADAASSTGPRRRPAGAARAPLVASVPGPGTTEQDGAGGRDDQVRGRQRAGGPGERGGARRPRP